ncbi:MAG: CHAT domain-containing protein [Planctomycetota bacterium]|nr:CHAT domain-containing protein [Planctomycetota bacterium]
MLCVKTGRQTTWHSQVIPTLVEELGLQSVESAESAHQQLTEMGVPKEWGLAWTSDVCHALAGMLRHCKETKKAYQVAGAFVQHFCVHCYEDWRQAVGGQPEEFRLADGRFESDVRSESLLRWAMLFANSAVELGYRDEGRQAAMLWGGLETTNGATPLDRLIHRAVRDSLQSTLPFDWIECFLNAFCGDPSAPRLPASQITALFRGMDVGDLFNIFENDALNAFLPPTRRVKFFAWCLYVLDSQDPAFEPFCTAVIDAVRKVSFDELKRIDDRRQMAETMNSLRWVLTTRCLASATQTEGGTCSVIAPERLLTLIEQLDNRILLEEMLLRRTLDQPEDKSLETTGTITSSWTMTGEHWNREQVRPRFSKWYSGIQQGTADLNGMALSACLGQISEQIDDSTPDELDSSFPEAELSNSTEHERLSEAASRPVSLGNIVPGGAIWIRTLFGNDGTLYWWALRRPSRGSSVEVIGSGQSEQSGARRRLELANVRLDAEIELIWAVCSGQWDPANWPSRMKFASSLKTGWKQLQSITAPDERSKKIGKTRTALSSLVKCGLPHSAGLGERFLDSVENASVADEERQILYQAWEGLVRILDAKQSDTPFPGYEAAADGIAKWKDRALNRVCERHRGTVAWELNLSSFFQSGPTLTSDSHVIFTVEGPLLAAPISSISIAGKPLFSQVKSVTTSISLSFNDVARPTRRSHKSNQDRKQILSAIWEEPERRVHVNGLPFLHAGVCDLVDHERVYFESLPNSSERNAWKVVSLTDEPLLTPSILTATLKSGHFDIVVVGGHGHLSKSGVALAKADELSPTDESERSLLWTGDGDFFQTDLVVLCSCAVGRLNQHSGTDVAGLYTRIAANGGRTIVSARWLIDDLHAAYFILAFLRHYMRLQRERGEGVDFIRSEAFNEARKECYSKLEQNLPAAEWHVFTAFDIYGLP